jgi:hypothetical protein
MAGLKTLWTTLARLLNRPPVNLPVGSERTMSVQGDANPNFTL